MSKRSKTRRLAKLRAELYGEPWAIDARTLGKITHAIETSDLDAVQAVLSFNQPAESIAKIINGIAVIPVTGALREETDYMVRWGYASSYQQIEQEFNQAIENSQIKGVLFYHNSPGGSAIGCKRVADGIFDARGIKPIHSYVQGVCASADYYIASASDRIVATADSLIGSVGTILPHQEFSGMLKEFGVSATVFTNSDSPKKGHGNVFEPLSDDAKKTLQQFVDSYGRPFIEDVARYRDIAAEEVIAKFGQGDAMRADVAIGQGMIDAVVKNFEEAIASISGIEGNATSPQQSAVIPPIILGTISKGRNVMNERIKAQLFALGLIESLDASDAECKAALRGWFGNAESVPSSEAETLKALQSAKPGNVAIAAGEPEDEDGDDEVDDDDEGESKAESKSTKAAKNVRDAHSTEHAEARLADLRAAASLVNQAVGCDAVSAEMVLDAFEKKLNANTAMKTWNETLAEKETPLPNNRIRITGEGRDQFVDDAVSAMLYRAGQSEVKLSDGAANLVNKPLWVIAGECLKRGGEDVDMYGDRELIAEQAMTMGNSHRRHTFYSANEGRQYIQAGSPANRPGDFPNLLSSLANRYLDTIQLDDDYSFTEVSAVLPGGLSDFKPGMMVNKGIVEELDELQDAEQFKELGLEEEVLSYIFLRRFGNKFGWTPVMVANDDMGAFVEGMIGLNEAWQVTQNRLVVDLYTSNPTLLDGNALFANRADTGSGSNPAANNNLRTGGAAPSDTEWGAMETLYADIGGISTGRRVRGTLNTCFCPTGSYAQEARRTFLPLNAMGLEGKVANTTANVGLYRGEVNVIPESELRVASSTVWYGLRNPTRLNTATVVRGYFNGFGTAGRRERWYDPENKTTWVSLEGRIATAVKNWRYAVRNET